MSETKRPVQQEGKSPKAEECHWENHFPGGCSGEQTKQTQKDRKVAEMERAGHRKWTRNR